MERLKYKNGEAAKHVNLYDFKYPPIHQQEISGGDFDLCSNKSEKEAPSLLRKHNLIYNIDNPTDDSSSFEIEMEDTIVNLNHQIQNLHEELESKKTSLIVLQDELVNSRSSMHELKNELENKNKNIRELNEELIKRNILLNEANEIKHNFNESLKRVYILEESLREKDKALEVNARLINTVKMELQHERETAFLLEKDLTKRNEEFRARYENDIILLKQQYSEKLKEILDNNSLKEKFLEKQIEMLFNRIEELTERGESHQQEYETVKRAYEEEYNEMKSKVDEISKSSGSHIQELNNKLAASLSNEVALKVELKSKIDDEKKLNEELINLKIKYEEIFSNEKNLYKKIKQNEIQLDLLKEEKEELQKKYMNANNLCEEMNNSYNRERKEMLKDHKDIIKLYENDLCNLVKALEDLYHCVTNLYFNFNEELSNTESEESIFRLPIISKEAFSNSYFYAAMKIVCDTLSESVKIRKELKNLIQDYQSVRLAFNARKKTCEENALQLASLQNEIMTLEKEKECAVNNLKYVQEQNDLLKYDNLKKQAEVVEVNNDLIKCKDELNKYSQQRDENFMQLANINLSPIAPNYNTVSESKLTNDENMLDTTTRSVSVNNAVLQLAASTPYQRNFCDPEGGGEFVKPKSYKSKSEMNLSLVKWMEKCHELEKENKRLNSEVETLTLQVQDLKFSSQFLKEEMNAYEEIRIKLEQKLSNHLTLKKQYTELQDENEKLNNEARNLHKDLDYLRGENLELSNKNVALEEKYGKYLIELTENKDLESNAVTNETIINNINEKVQEIIGLKGEIRSLSDDKKYLTRKVDLLLDANNIYSGKIEETYSELLSCKNELEKIRNERMDIYSDNRLLNKEVQLLQLRLDYITALRDNHKCTSGSLSQTEDLVQELILFVRGIMENKLEGSTSEMEDPEKEGNKIDKTNLQEILKTLNHQLNEEKLDFDEKLNELQHIITDSKNEGLVTDDWVVQLDKKLRKILEELKFHKEQYNRIEEALRSTGKFHDELQKQKDQLRIKDHEITSFQKKINEEKIQVKKFACHVKYLQQELEEKNDIIKTTLDQKYTLEKELKDLQRKLYDVEKKYEMEIKAAEWKLQQAKLFNIENEVDKKFFVAQKIPEEKWQLGELGSENWERVREEVERVYQNALQQVQYFFNAEVSSSVTQVQKEHKEQIEELQRIIDEQAIKIGMLMKKNAVEDGLNSDPTYINEYKKQFELATFALQQLHQEEIQLLRLQFEADKHYEIYKAIYENQQNVNKEGIYLKSTGNSYMEENLSRRLESALLEDFLFRLQIIDFEIQTGKIEVSNEFITKYTCPYCLQTLDIKQSLLEIENYKQICRVEILTLGTVHSFVIYAVQGCNDRDLLKNEEIIYSQFYYTLEENGSFFIPVCCFSRRNFSLPCVISFSDSYCFIDASDILKVFNKKSESLNNWSLMTHLKTFDKFMGKMSGRISKVIVMLFKEFFLNPNLRQDSTNLMIRLMDVLCRCVNFIAGWHGTYTKEVTNIKNNLQCGINKYLNEEIQPENLKKIDNENQELINQHYNLINSAKDFLSSMETERNNIMKNLKTFVEIYEKNTGELFEKINIQHSDNAELLSLKDELIQIKKEKEELEKLHKNAIELLNADHKTEQNKIQDLLNEIKQCFESSCDPNALIKLQSDLEERHRKELEDLRTYFEEKCANLGKQYSEDVNSLHSRMLSISSSCSDEIMSDHIGFDRGGAGDMMYSEVEVDNVTTLDKLTPEQYKLIEELNYKWSENVKEMKKELEKKYSKKIEQLQEKLSTFVYNNELDITVRCIKEDVMRDCKLEVEEIKKELSSRLLASGDYLEEDNKNTDEQLRAVLCERDTAWEQIIDVMGNSLSQEAINKITIEIIWDALKKSDLQEKIILKVSELLNTMEEKLSLITVKLKNKESQLHNMQNKMNSCSQLYSETLEKQLKNNEFNFQKEIFESPHLLEKLIAGNIENTSIPTEIVQVKNVLQQLYEEKLLKEKEKQSVELETLKKFYIEKEKEHHNQNSQLIEKLMKGDFDETEWPLEIVQIKTILQQNYEKKLIEEKEKNSLEMENLEQMYKEKECSKAVCLEDYGDLDRVIQERDNLKQMTVTLKSAVSQLVSYLNTCEDELNKTVVEELLKVYVETPKKSTLEYESLDNTPDCKKVHFAPEVGISDLDLSQDISAALRLQLDSCLSKLKLEAASLLGLTALQPPPANLNKQIENLRKENEELLQEIIDLKIRLDKNQSESLELRDQFSADLTKENSFTYLQDKAQQFLNGTQNNPQETVRVLEEISKLGDNLIHELQKEKIDLQQQIVAADKQLRSTRQFLEEQAAERETERDDYTKEILNLQVQLREKGKNLSSHERFTNEVLEPVPQKLGKISLSVEELEIQLKESQVLLEECEKKKGAVEAELKDAIDKVWVLRDIISDLESQLTSKSEKEALLEQKLDELETELDQQNGTQYAMAQELESLRSQSLDDGYLDQIKQLEENIRVQFNSTVVRQLKTQLRDLEKTLDHRTKELETVYLNNSNNSLSSPSEEVSVREQLEWSRSRTPEPCPSPVALPVDEVSKLQDKFLRHVRAEEMLIKRLRDQQLIAVKFQVELEEMHAERDVLQKQMKKQMVSLAEANNKIDDLRHKVETAQTTANKDLVSQIQELKEKYSQAEQALDSTHNQLIEHKIQLSHAEEIISKQKIEISNLAHCDHEIVDSLRLELAAVTAERNKLEDLLDKYKRDFNLDVVNALLVDKNEDIEHLQHTVNLLQSQKEDDEKQGSCNSKGYRVSFAADIENSNCLADDIQLRDAPNMQSLDLYPDNFQVFGGSISPILHENEEKHFSTSMKSFTLSNESILGSSSYETEDIKLLLENLRSELQEKNDKIVSLEKEIDYLKSIEEDLKNTKSELETVVTSVSEDKKFYEKELHLRSEKLSKKDEEVRKLRNIMKQKDEEILKTTADVQSLREISLNLQEKLREAKELAEKENNHVLKEDLGHLNEELVSKEKEIAELEQELQLFKSDYNDEKELCETLKFSLNTISEEKQNLEANISSLRHENRNLLNDLQVAEDRLNQYVIAVRNLKNDLSSKTNALETKYVSSNSNASFIENEISTLQEEVVKLININENLFQERNNILKELNKVKSTINCEEFLTKDSLIGQLQDELNELRKAVYSVKEEKLEAFGNFSKEICQLHKDIDALEDSKQEALQKWNQELLEKQALQRQFESIKAELEVEKCHNEHSQLSRLQKLSLCQTKIFEYPPVSDNIVTKAQKLSLCRAGFLDIQPVSHLPVSRVQRLSFCSLGTLDIQPVSDFPGIDALADKMRKEIKLSATLDNSLLESILPESSEEYQGSSEVSETVSGQYMTITSRLRSLEKALLTEMEKAREARNGLREKETKYRVAEAEKNEIKLRMERLGRMLSAHEEKIGQLSNQLKTEKEKVITLELMVSKEQAALKQLSTLLEEERTKARESQKDDIALIETMRKRLQSLMENETILKQMVREERQKSNNLVAQLNSVQAFERYRSDSEDESVKNRQKILLQERNKYFQMKVECEKERRTCEDLREVLARERTALCFLQDNLAKSEKNRCHIEKEITALRQKLQEEMVRRELAERKIVENQGIEDTKFQKQLQAIEARNKKSLETAYAVIRELEQEYNDLKIYIRAQQEQDEKWKDRIHLPLIQQLNEVNDNLDALIKERVDLKRTIDRLSDENNRLHVIVDDLRRQASTPSERLSIASNDLQVPNVALRGGTEAVTPFIEREVDDLLDRVLRAEKHKKALVFQKRYLLVALRGHQDAQSETMHLLRWHHRNRHRRRKFSFRSVVFVVIATVKIQRLPLKRIGIYHKRREILLNTLKRSLSRSTAEMERLTTAPTSRHTAPHSPPSRDRATQRFR